MKKFAVAMVAVVSAIIMCFALAACSSSLEGTYKFYSMSMSYGGVSVDVNVNESMGGSVFDENTVTLTANADGTFVLTMNMMGEQETQEGTWEKKDGKYYLVLDGEEQEATLSGKKLTFTANSDGMSMKLVLVKQ